jgi:hypothetical protein
MGIAAMYVSGLRQLMSRSGSVVALQGVIVGGGYYDDGPGRLGVWLTHDPADFGMAAIRSTRRQVSVADGTMRTGLSDAWRTDLEDDSYDLSWLTGLPVADRPAVAMLRTLLEQEHDPIDRHFQFAELEACRNRALVKLEEQAHPNMAKAAKQVTSATDRNRLPRTSSGSGGASDHLRRLGTPNQPNGAGAPVFRRQS